MVKREFLELVSKYILLIPDEMELRKVFIFGSCAKGKENQDSDIDVALVFEKVENFFDIQVKLMNLRWDVDLRIEPHPFELNSFNDNDPFANQILKEGIEIIPEKLEGVLGI